MSLRSNGSYIGPRPAGPSSGVASGIWDLRTAERQMRAAAWPTPSFNPASVGTVLAWYDAADTATLFDATSGGATPSADAGVARWEDKSGNGYHATQATSANRPVRKVSQINSRDALYFNSDSLAASVQFANAAFSVFVVAYKTGQTSEGYNAWLSEFSGTSTGYLQLGMGGFNTYLAISKTGLATSEANLTAPTSAAVLAYLSDGISSGNVSVDAYKNGTQASGALTLTSLSTAANTNIGASRQGIADLLVGYIGEIIIYSQKLSAGDRQTVESYLSTKWGIA